MTEQIFVDNFLQSIWHYEHPLNDPNTLCIYHLAKNAGKHITVLLTGDAADEIFLINSVRRWRRGILIGESAGS